MECARRRRLAGGVGNKQRNENAEIVCERRLRQRARHRDEGAVSGALATVGSNLSFRKPKRSLVVSGIYGAYDQRCSDLAMTVAAEWRM